MRTIAFLLTILAGIAPASAEDLAGRWTVRWGGDSKNENQMTLRIDAGRVSGNYLNDSKANCSVSGNTSPASRKFALTILCPQWDIRMEGVQAADQKSATGRYQAYIDAHGKFDMRR